MLIKVNETERMLKQIEYIKDSGLLIKYPYNDSISTEENSRL